MHFKWCLPGILKIGRIFPVFKSSTTEKLSNYCPITSLLTINKIFEKLTYHKIINFVYSNNILTNSQYDFRKKTCTTFAWLRLINDLLCTFNMKYFTIGLLFNLFVNDITSIKKI